MSPIELFRTAKSGLDKQGTFYSKEKYKHIRYMYMAHFIQSYKAHFRMFVAVDWDDKRVN